MTSVSYEGTTANSTNGIRQDGTAGGILNAARGTTYYAANGTDDKDRRGAGAVVTRDIPPNTFAAGVPCAVIREIGDRDRLRNHPELFADPKDMRFFR